MTRDNRWCREKNFLGDTEIGSRDVHVEGTCSDTARVTVSEWVSDSATKPLPNLKKEFRGTVKGETAWERAWDYARKVSAEG